MNDVKTYGTILAVSTRNFEERPLDQGNLWYSHFLRCLICTVLLLLLTQARGAGIRSLTGQGIQSN